MKLYLINDTRGFHAGSTAAVQGMIDTLTTQGHEVVATTKVGGIPGQNISASYDAVLCNGEGTLHHHNGQGLLNFLAKVSPRLKTFLVNTVWDGMTPFDAKKILGLTNLMFRDRLSFQQFVQSSERTNLTAEKNMVMGVWPDACTTPSQTLGGKPIKQCRDKIVIGQFYAQQGLPANWFFPLEMMQSSKELALCQFQTLGLNEGSWADLIATLRGARIYITGQHHGVYLAMLADVPFVACVGNCHKIEGIFDLVASMAGQKVEELFLDNTFMPLTRNVGHLPRMAREYMDGRPRELFKVFLHHFARLPPWPGLVKKVRSDGKPTLYKG